MTTNRIKLNNIKGVLVVIQDFTGKYLLQFRDSTKGISAPLTWSFFTGSAEEGEDAIEAARRETEEELNVSSARDCFETFGHFKRPHEKIYVLRMKKPVCWEDLKLREGAGMGFFLKEELPRLTLSPPTIWTLKQNIF